MKTSTKWIFATGGLLLLVLYLGSHSRPKTRKQWHLYRKPDGSQFARFQEAAAAGSGPKPAPPQSGGDDSAMETLRWIYFASLVGPWAWAVYHLTQRAIWGNPNLMIGYHKWKSTEGTTQRTITKRPTTNSTTEESGPEVVTEPSV